MYINIMGRESRERESERNYACKYLQSIHINIIIYIHVLWQWLQLLLLSVAEP